jgi:hypothetical protein
MTDMLVMVPTRERPANVSRFAKAAAETMAGVASVLFILDEDDPLLDDNITAVQQPGHWPYLIRIQQRMITVPKLNFAALAYQDAFPVLMFTGDDTVPVTPWWDAEIVKTISAMGGTGMTYPNGLGRTDIPEHVAISTDIIRALGWFALPQLSHYYCDNAWADIGNGAGCLQFREDIILEHLNPLYGKGPRDYLIRIAEQRAAADNEAYWAWREHEMAADIAKVRTLIQGGPCPAK